MQQASDRKRASKRATGIHAGPRLVQALVGLAAAFVAVFLYIVIAEKTPRTPEGLPPLPERYEPVVVRTLSDRAKKLTDTVEALRPFQQALPVAGPNDWLSIHDEPGQSFSDYINAEPVQARGKRKIIYIQPLGEFDDTQGRIVDLTADFMSRYFNLSVTIRRPISLDSVPERAKRVHALWKVTQILTTYVLDEVLRPTLPDDAAAYIAFTTSDLWPGRGWNFVFGQASLSERVGVWSLYRQGDPHTGDAEFKRCLFRTLKIATHETGHLFSMQHCTAYACNMCGSNNREESDRNPLHLCCECVAKLCWATGSDPLKRYERLTEFCDENGLYLQSKVYSVLRTALNAAPAENHFAASGGGVVGEDPVGGP